MLFQKEGTEIQILFYHPQIKQNYSLDGHQQDLIWIILLNHHGLRII